MDNIKILQRFNLKKTKPRLLVLDILSSFKEPIDVKSIHSKLKKLVDRVTIYRILKCFRDNGIVFSDVDRGVEKYYLSKDRHHHVSCQKCGFTQCLPFKKLIFNIKNFADVQYRISLVGLCRRCR